MINQERRRQQDSGPRRRLADRRVSIDDSYNGLERRNGRGRRIIIDRRR